VGLSAVTRATRSRYGTGRHYFWSHTYAAKTENRASGRRRGLGPDRHLGPHLFFLNILEKKYVICRRTPPGRTSRQGDQFAAVQKLRRFPCRKRPRKRTFFSAATFGHFRACRAPTFPQDIFPSHLDAHRIDRCDTGYTLVASDGVVAYLLLAAARETCRKWPESAEFFSFGQK
jgi:hypothetical protein